MPLLDFISHAKSESRAQVLASLSPVIIMGRGHSGTRVVSWICTHLGILLGSSEDSQPGDVSDKGFQKEIKAIALQSLEVTRADQVEPALARRFQRAVFGYYEELGEPAGLWGWKFPETYLIGPCVAATFPKARYVHLVRDGRDVAFKNHLTDDPRRELGRAILKLKGTLKQPHHLQAASSWAFQVDHFDAFRASLPEDQVFNLTFNQLCTGPNETVAGLCEFLNVPMTDACRRYLDEQVLPSKVSQYRESGPQQVGEVEALIGPTLSRYGFIP